MVNAGFEPLTATRVVAADLSTVRVMLMLGGRRWLMRRLDGVLSTLADRTLRAAEGIDEVARSAPAVTA